VNQGGGYDLKRLGDSESRFSRANFYLGCGFISQKRFHRKLDIDEIWFLLWFTLSITFELYEISSPLEFCSF